MTSAEYFDREQALHVERLALMLELQQATTADARHDVWHRLAQWNRDMGALKAQCPPAVVACREQAMGLA